MHGPIPTLPSLSSKSPACSAAKARRHAGTATDSITAAQQSRAPSRSCYGRRTTTRLQSASRRWTGLRGGGDHPHAQDCAVEKERVRRRAHHLWANAHPLATVPGHTRTRPVQALSSLPCSPSAGRANSALPRRVGRERHVSECRNLSLGVAGRPINPSPLPMRHWCSRASWTALSGSHKGIP